MPRPLALRSRIPVLKRLAPAQATQARALAPTARVQSASASAQWRVSEGRDDPDNRELNAKVEENGSIALGPFKRAYAELSAIWNDTDTGAELAFKFNRDHSDDELSIPRTPNHKNRPRVFAPGPVEGTDDVDALRRAPAQLGFGDSVDMDVDLDAPPRSVPPPVRARVMLAGHDGAWPQQRAFMHGGAACETAFSRNLSHTGTCLHPTASAAAGSSRSAAPLTRAAASTRKDVQVKTAMDVDANANSRTSAHVNALVADIGNLMDTLGKLQRGFAAGGKS